MKRKYTAGLLAVILLVNTLASCGGADTEEQTDTAADTQETTPIETTIYDVLQPNDYEGYTFRILNNLSNVAYTNIGEEGLTGESLDDAMYNRNLRVAEELNIAFQIINHEYQDTKDTITNMVVSDDDVYDMYTLDLSHMVSHATNGFLWNTNEIDAIDINNPWWNKTAIDSVTLCDYAFSLFGDLHVGYFETFYPAVFNKTMIKELNLPDPYQLVRDGTWTLDVMIEMMMSVKNDADGDGKWTTADRYPFSMYQDNAPICLLHTSNINLFVRDEKGVPVWNGLPEKYLTTYEKLASTMFSDQHNNAHNAGGSLGAGLPVHKHHAMMYLGNTLFLFEPLGAVKNLRDVEFGIGIAPLPKYDEAQENYLTYIFHCANAIAIPITNPDAERTGVILEHMAAYSHETVRDVFFNTTLDFKYAQDQEGQEMLDIMFAGGTFELGYVYGWGGVVWTLNNNVKEGKMEITSALAAIESKTQAAIQETIAIFTELNG
ncbi:MAG: hypothetical protein E7631_12625 [Ruminococcaceae bacterium]|nr:hypothetical protein [Oscillospiraceae bacterium]